MHHLWNHTYLQPNLRNKFLYEVGNSFRIFYLHINNISSKHPEHIACLKKNKTKVSTTITEVTCVLTSASSSAPSLFAHAPTSSLTWTELLSAEVSSSLHEDSDKDPSLISWTVCWPTREVSSSSSFLSWKGLNGTATSDVVTKPWFWGYNFNKFYNFINSVQERERERERCVCVCVCVCACARTRMRACVGGGVHWCM